MEAERETKERGRGGTEKVTHVCVLIVVQNATNTTN